MQYKPKISKRLISLLMSVVMTLASVTFMVQIQEPITTQAAGVMKNKNMVSGSQNCIMLSGNFYVI